MDRVRVTSRILRDTLRSRFISARAEFQKGVKYRDGYDMDAAIFSRAENWYRDSPIFFSCSNSKFETYKYPINISSFQTYYNVWIIIEEEEERKKKEIKTFKSSEENKEGGVSIGCFPNERR